MSCLRLNLSNKQIAAELGLNKDDVQKMTAPLRSGIVAKKKKSPCHFPQFERQGQADQGRTAVYEAEWGKGACEAEPDNPDCIVKAYGHNGYFKSLAGIVHFYNTRDVKPLCPGLYTEAEALAADCWPAPEVADNVKLALLTRRQSKTVAVRESGQRRFFHSLSRRRH